MVVRGSLNAEKISQKKKRNVRYINKFDKLLIFFRIINI